MHAYACFPLVSAGRTIGTLSLGTKNRSTFSPEDLALIEAVAQHMSIALERRHAREELRRSQELYRTIARNIPDGGVWVVDRELRYVLVEGPLAHRYLSGSDVEGRLLSEVLAGPMLDVSTARFQKALAGESNGYEDEFDGRVMWNRFVPLTDEEGHVPFGMALMLDITDRKRMEEQIRQAQKLESVGLLAGGVAHDFNNLLVGILGNASLAQDLIPADHAIRPLLESVARAGEQAANLTRQMLAYSGKGRFVVETLDLSEVVREIVPLARMSLTKRIELRLDTRPGLPPIEADRTQVQQVVTNLVINAGEAIGTEPGHIAIMTGLRRSVDGGADFVFLEVRDTGCGMSEEIRSRVFDPFFSTKFTGRGLGLAAVHGIMRGHGGSISVESTPGAGSTFTALFPASAKVVARTNGRAALPASDAGRGTVLVVDDEPVVRDMAAAALKRFGYEVLLAEDGWQALDVMREHRDGISVVLLDLSMPGLDGEQALPELRKLSPDVAVLVSSGFSETEAMRVFAGQNVAGFVQKPYTVRQLLAKIGAVAGG
jgi:PAS domain S-box-containing protein